MGSSLRSRNFATLYYPDSTNFQDLKNFLENLHVPCFISPLHDSDTLSDERERKPHWHVQLIFEGKKSKQQIQEMLEGSNYCGIETVNDCRSYARYLCHLDQPDKHQYSIDEVVELSGANYQATIEIAANNTEACRNMIEWCNENHVLGFDQLVDYAMKERSDWFMVLHHGGIMIVKEYLKSKNWRLQKIAEYERTVRNNEKDRN